MPMPFKDCTQFQWLSVSYSNKYIQENLLNRIWKMWGRNITRTTVWDKIITWMQNTFTKHFLRSSMYVVARLLWDFFLTHGHSVKIFFLCPCQVTAWPPIAGWMFCNMLLIFWQLQFHIYIWIIWSFLSWNIIQMFLIA